MAKALANGIEIEWDARGDEAAPAMLLIMGLGGQLTRWSDDLMDALAGRGFRAIRFDNRDVGLSTKFDGAGVPDLAKLGLQLATGRKPDVPYRLDDVAADAVGYPDRVLSLTSVMSTTGNPALPRATAAANAVLMGGRAAPISARSSRTASGRRR